MKRTSSSVLSKKAANLATSGSAKSRALEALTGVYDATYLNQLADVELVLRLRQMLGIRPDR